MKIRIIAAVVMAVLAVAGLVLINNYVGDADARALADQEAREVLLVTAPIPEGTPVEEFGASVKQHLMPAATVPENAVTNLDDFPGKVAGVDLQPGEQVLESRLVDPAALEEPGTVPVPKGLQEVTITLGPDRVVGGQLKAGDRVGVFVTFTDDGNGKARTTQEFHRVLVTSLQGAPATTAASDGSEASASDTPPVPEAAMLVTLAFNAAEAEEIIFASELGSIWLSAENKDAIRNDDGAKMEDFG